MASDDGVRLSGMVHSPWAADETRILCHGIGANKAILWAWCPFEPRRFQRAGLRIFAVTVIAPVTPLPSVTTRRVTSAGRQASYLLREPSLTSNRGFTLFFDGRSCLPSRRVADFA